MTGAGNVKPRIGLVLSGYAPAMTLASGAMLGFKEKGIEFDVISTSGPGALIALLALAPADNNPTRALEELPNLYMSDLTYATLPVSLRLGAKNSPLAKPMYQLGKMLPRFTIAPDDPAVIHRFFNDWMDWAVTAMTPAFEWNAPGLLSHSPRLKEMIDFSKLRKASTRFYVSAFDLVKKNVEIFDNRTTDYDAFCASQSSSLFYPPHRVLRGDGGCDLFFSGLSYDATGLQAIWLKEKQTLDMVLAFDPIIDAVWREPTDIGDAFQLMLANPIAALKIVTLGLYAHIDQALEKKHDSRRRLPPLYRISVPLGDYPRTEILKWTHSNAVALQKIGRRAATDFADVLLSGDKAALEQQRFWRMTPNDSGWDVMKLHKALFIGLEMNKQGKKTPRVVRRRVPGADWRSEYSDLALLVGGGAPNLHLSAGALCAFYENKISFDAISASGAGALPALLYAAPAEDGSQVRALQETVNLNIADEIERLIPMNFKVFFKSGPFADPAWRLAQALPRFTMRAKERYTNDLKRLYNDTLDLMIAIMTPTTLNPLSTGMCTRVGMLDKVIAWDRLASYPKQFYLNAFNLKTRQMETFSKDKLTEERFWAALAMPWLFAPAKVDGMTYTEGASHEPSGLGALLLHYNRTKGEYPGAEGFTLSPFNQLGTIIALETVGSNLWANPETLYDALQVTIMEPIVSLAEIVQATYGLFEYVVNKERPNSAPKLYRVPFPVPDWEVRNILRWNYSNALTLWNAGHSAAKEFIEAMQAGEKFEKYRYYPSVKDKPRVKDMLKVFAELLAGRFEVGL